THGTRPHDGARRARRGRRARDGDRRDDPRRGQGPGGAGSGAVDDCRGRCRGHGAGWYETVQRTVSRRPCVARIATIGFAAMTAVLPYPMKVVPRLLSKPWGGRRIETVLHRKLPIDG